jgi:sugar phosphate isomerase/epimerase
MITRRSFILKSASATAALLTMNSMAEAMEGNNKLKKFGYITGIIGKELEGDWKQVMKETASYGFTEIETGGYLGDSASAYLSFCKEIGLIPVAGGIPFTTDPDELNPKLDDLLKLEMKYAVTYWPWKTGGPFKLDDCKKSAEVLNQMGELVNRKGLSFCWHNHNKEFIAMEEGMPFDFLMEQTDRKLVKCEMDIYWVQKGGANPLSMLKKYAGRIPILHVKDMAPGDAQDFECPGSGIIDFPSIFAEAAKQDIQHYFVERDNCPDGMACLKSSGAYLKGLRF